MFKDFFAAVLSWLHSSVLQRHIWEQRNVFCLFGQRYKGTFGHHSGAITLEYIVYVICFVGPLFHLEIIRRSRKQRIRRKNDTNFHLEIIHNGNGEADVSAGQNVQVVLLEVLQQLPSDLNKFFLICSYLIFILPTT